MLISFEFLPKKNDSPLSTESIKPIILSNVDFPEPEGPVIDINSPLFTFILKFSNTGILELP